MNEKAFWHKLKKFSTRIGCPLACLALKLFYAARKPEVPAWAKGVIFGALAYLITPIDTIPDFIPGAGYSDDLGALTAALVLVSMYIDSDVKARAAEQTRKLFKDCDC